MVGIVAGLAVGLLVGLAAGFLAADWIQDKARRDAGVLTARQRYELQRFGVDDDEAPLTERERYELMQIEQRHASLTGKRALGQPFPYQPPVIVLAAPRAQAPQVVQSGTAVTRY